MCQISKRENVVFQLLIQSDVSWKLCTVLYQLFLSCSCTSRQKGFRFNCSQFAAHMILELHYPIFAIKVYTIKSPKGKRTVFRRFYSLHIQNRKETHKNSFSEPQLCLWSFLKCISAYISMCFTFTTVLGLRTKIHNNDYRLSFMVCNWWQLRFQINVMTLALNVKVKYT